MEKRYLLIQLFPVMVCLTLSPAAVVTGTGTLSKVHTRRKNYLNILDQEPSDHFIKADDESPLNGQIPSAVAMINMAQKYQAVNREVWA